MSDGWAFAAFIGGLLAFVGLIIVVVWLAIAWPIAETSCNQRGENIGLPSDYKLISNVCYVEVPGGRWINVDDYRVVQRGER